MNDFPFYTMDMVVLIVLVWSALVGFTRGIVREVAAILALLVAAVGSVLLFPHARSVVAEYIDAPVITNALTWLGLFFLIYVIAKFLFSTLRGKAEAAQMNGLDRGLGFGFGAARAAILLSILLMFVNWLVPLKHQPEWLTDFQSRTLLERAGEALKKAVPESTIKNLAEDAKALQKFSANLGLKDNAENTEKEDVKEKDVTPASETENVPEGEDIEL